MCKKYFLLLFFLLNFQIFSQEKYITRNGYVSFNASTLLEDIKPVNKYVSCILDTYNGDIVFQLKMISFEFKNALMQEHFNEKYVESDKYPKSTFSGRVLDWDLSVLELRDTISVSGIINIHGINKEIIVDGVINRSADQVLLSASFDLRIEDFDIQIPKIVQDKISENVIVNVNMRLDKMKK